MAAFFKPPNNAPVGMALAVLTVTQTSALIHSLCDSLDKEIFEYAHVSLCLRSMYSLPRRLHAALEIPWSSRRTPRPGMRFSPPVKRAASASLSTVSYPSLSYTGKRSVPSIR